MALVTNLANLDVISETWVDAVKDGLNTGVFSGSYTPTLGGIAVGTGGSATNIAYYSYVGGLLVVQGTIQFGTAGQTFPSASHTISLPSGFTPAMAVTPNYATVGVAQMVAGGVSANGSVTLVTATQVRLGVWGAATTYAVNSNLSTAIPGTWVAGDYARWTAHIVGTMA